MIFRKAFADSLPVLMGYSAMGFAAGVLLAVDGGLTFSPLWAGVSSAVFVSGPLQYLFVDWVRSSMSIGSVLLIVACVNFRYSFYGLSLMERFSKAGRLLRFYLIFGITDETYALESSCKLQGKAYLRYCFFLTALDHLYWIAGVTSGTITGVFATGMLSHEKACAFTEGIDFAMTALFIVILTDQCRDKLNWIPALIGALASTIAFCWFGRTGMLIPSIILIVITFAALRRKLDVR